MSISINYVGFDESTGYGVAAANFVKALQSENVDVNFIKIKPGHTEKGGIFAEDHSINNKNYHLAIIHTVPEYYPYWFKFEKAKNENCKVWGYTAWETDKIPGHWPDFLNQMDGIFVPSHWNKHVFQKCGVTTRIEVLPHISEFEGKCSTSVINKELQSVFNKVGDHFLFYSIGVWSERKAPWHLLQAFTEEFAEEENVSLILKTGKEDWVNFRRRWQRLFRKEVGSSSQAFQKAIRSYKPHDNIYHIDSELTNDDMANLHKRGNCFISCTRGEGWGMGSYEATWFGKAVAITPYGGVIDYLPKEYAYLFDYRLIPVNCNYGKASYSADQNWADVILEDAKRKMRHLFENSQERNNKGVLLRDYMMRNYSSAHIVKQFMEVFTNG
ncbi:glycosyltransferase [Schinkia azotoformans MEV2011]|uniref:Glycosyltransferase n=1 Tax=Schinkia azotoformans MEV2011 TaxID=1348973 RepID=A0A072NQ14_SCHAZ|nr:glycosyltransferase family 1 protein [Schinkia azotoformans]KEF39759.1 glycosyltransferase [Schinkia azotoformans MEV2011]MEC1695022.1 glycosyltransferase family 1 protein [Schinkia azotoformans]MEC1726828.1 glycosyltransferase family 1 protein [Schinkia azotoformans]MEC1781917.1 glycosyltransferase family 1 protein [Schinkia azotoformans]MED4328786.1 glycosyltransferase family 1 protein [Schinkia azotoformans]